MRKLLIAATIGALGAASIAMAGASLIPSDISLQDTGPGVYEGMVTSPKPACEKKRKVSVRHDQNLNGWSTDDYEIGTAKTASSGKYKVTGNQAPDGDQIAARAAKKTLPSGAVCKAAKVTATAHD